MRGVQSFPPQQGADLARRPGHIGLGQDPQLVPDGELASPRTLESLWHLGVRHHRDRHGRRVSGFEGTVLRQHGFRAFSTLVTNYSIVGVSASIDREGGGNNWKGRISTQHSSCDSTGATLFPCTAYGDNGTAV